MVAKWTSAAAGEMGEQFVVAEHSTALMPWTGFRLYTSLKIVIYGEEKKKNRKTKGKPCHTYKLFIIWTFQKQKTVPEISSSLINVLANGV